MTGTNFEPESTPEEAVLKRQAAQIKAMKNHHQLQLESIRKHHEAQLERTQRQHAAELKALKHRPHLDTSRPITEQVAQNHILEQPVAARDQ